jgi:hypothetical protein
MYLNVLNVGKQQAAEKNSVSIVANLLTFIVRNVAKNGGLCSIISFVPLVVSI